VTKTINGVGHDEETIGEKRTKDKRSTTSLHSTVLEYGYDGRALQSVHWQYFEDMVNELIAKLYRHIHTPKLSNVGL
jgi:hypothetical protein